MAKASIEQQKILQRQKNIFMEENDAQSKMITKLTAPPGADDHILFFISVVTIMNSSTVFCLHLKGNILLRYAKLGVLNTE